MTRPRSSTNCPLIVESPLPANPESLAVPRHCCAVIVTTLCCASQITFTMPAHIGVSVSWFTVDGNYKTQSPTSATPMILICVPVPSACFVSSRAYPAAISTPPTHHAPRTAFYFPIVADRGPGLAPTSSIVHQVSSATTTLSRHRDWAGNWPVFVSHSYPKQ
jgi:hypothetical protein